MLEKLATQMYDFSLMSTTEYIFKDYFKSLTEKGKGRGCNQKQHSFFYSG